MFFFLIRCSIFVFFWIYIIPKWLIKVPGHIPILFGWFRELRKFCQNLVSEASGLSPKCFKKYKKKYGIILENIIFANMGYRFFRSCSRSVCPRYQFVRCFLFGFCLDFLVFFVSIYFENNFTKMRNWKWYIFHY